jgi:hypothetical protein
MAWVTPPTYTAGEEITTTLMNNISGNLALLKTSIDNSGGVLATQLQIAPTTSLQSNYAPGLVGNTVLTNVASGVSYIDGFASGEAGQRLTIMNASANFLALIASSVSVSAAQNQLLNISAGLPNSTLSLASGVTYLATGGWAEYIYDASATKWRMISFDQGSWLGGLAAAWLPTWTASGTAPVLGNGQLGNAWYLSGRTMHFAFFVLFGSTTTYGTGVWSFSLPSASPLGLVCPVVLVMTAGNWSATGLVAGGTSALTVIESHAGASPGIGPTTPATWASGNALVIQGEYVTA